MNAFQFVNPSGFSKSTEMWPKTSNVFSKRQLNNQKKKATNKLEVKLS